MQRADLSNVVMHIKALHFPRMAVQEVLAETIEPPAPERVKVAINSLKMVGALDHDENLTPLGRVLLQLPVDVQLGTMVLYGAFFKCLSRAVSLAAILSNRDPFLSPPLRKREAHAVKSSWVPEGSKSDVLATLAAYEEWASIQNKGHYNTAGQFCMDNYLSKPTMMLIHRIRGQLVHSLYQAGVMDISAGGAAASGASNSEHVPPELNVNAGSMPLLAGLVALATKPKFAVKLNHRLLRTNIDKVVLIHPSSTNANKNERDTDFLQDTDRDIMAFSEKRRSVNVGNAGQTFLSGTTKIPALPYVMFGAHDIKLTNAGLECDKWVHISGVIGALEEVRRLRENVHGCMLRVFEGLSRSSRTRKTQNGVVVPVHPRYEGDTESLVGEREYAEDNLDARDHRLSEKEMKELDLLTTDIVRILDEQYTNMQYIQGAKSKIDNIRSYMKSNKDKSYWSGSANY
ncbi:hypothetical protein M422DRAFT_271688 [Sphaerobolus stellatus SS14]|uniref:Helicase-associated domain-containing protein n=1 Tax=Sphaerobolus stellatus (strain SS14) TaxID=990650 RepID=A0A0C9UDL7_SPHS4|nr:hypothetical protein M422DRAFT_271688 [Sphaerobolus stellatus SS14]